jgi:hypothetical protein
MKLTAPLGGRDGNVGVDAAASCSPFGEHRRRSLCAVFAERQEHDHKVRAGSSVVVLLTVALLTGCQADDVTAKQAVHHKATIEPLPAVPPLHLTRLPARAVLQTIADAADPEATFVACGELLDREVTLETSQRKTVAVLMTMLVTQLEAPATSEGAEWTFFCRTMATPGKRFSKRRPPEDVTVPKTPEGPK